MTEKNLSAVDDDNDIRASQSQRATPSGKFQAPPTLSAHLFISSSGCTRGRASLSRNARCSGKLQVPRCGHISPPPLPRLHPRGHVLSGWRVCPGGVFAREGVRVDYSSSPYWCILLLAAYLALLVIWHWSLAHLAA